MQILFFLPRVDIPLSQGSQGRAYLFNSVVNVGCGPAEERVLLTGLHAVADIFCDCCKTTLGRVSDFSKCQGLKKNKKKALKFQNFLLLKNTYF